MSTKQWLQFHLVALCMLGSLFVALSTRSLAAPAGVLLAGVLSVLLTDNWKWLQVNRLVGNLAAIGAVFFSLRDFLNNNSEGQLLAIATLLVYLQVILFFQEKNARLYWQMILLSLLQVVVGAALHLGITFGILLLVYTAVAISTMVLFFLHREMELHAAALGLPATAASAAAKKLPGQAVEVRIEGQRQQLNDAFLSLALVRQIALLTLGSLIFSAAFFYTAPRHPAAAWSGARGFSRVETGFSRSVELQQMGELLQNDDPVMRVWLSDSAGRPLSRLDPYFAGEVLPIYETDEQGRARWVSIGMGSSLFRRQGEGSQDREDGEEPPLAPPEATRVKIAVAHASDSMFTIMPAYRLENATDKQIKMDKTAGTLFFDVRSDGNNSTNFTVATTGIKGNRQVPIAPENRPRMNPSRFRFREEIALCRKWGELEERRFKGIKEAADKALADRAVSRKDPILVARTLEEYFSTPGLYTYSLNLNVKREAQLDPIEDFVVNHRTGHCQYFASALVMMLRSQGLPARMVVGYRGNEYNEFGYYQVRQRNAHAWVEMYLEEGQVPEHEAVGGTIGKGGAWLRLDPTPGRDEANLADRNLIGSARDWLDYIDTIWGDYVVSLSQRRQEQTLYSVFQPNEDSAAPTISWEDWRDSLRTVASWFGIHFGEKGAGWKVAFDWRAALTAMVLSTLVLLLSRLIRWIWPQIDWSFLRWEQTGIRRSPVPFYNRLEDLLARRGRTRRPAETPQEYVDLAVRELGLMHGDALRRLVVAFYQVRFGGAKLSKDELAAIELSLNDLERRPLAAKSSPI